MLGMYAIYFLYVDFGAPLPLAFLGGVLVVAVLGVILHQLVIRPILHTEPINQLLVTGGVLFFLQGLATMLFSVEFRNLGVSFGSVEAGEMRSEEHTSELQSLMRISYAVFCLKKNKNTCTTTRQRINTNTQQTI